MAGGRVARDGAGACGHAGATAVAYVRLIRTFQTSGPSASYAHSN